tara:strand:+ start:37385 stop:38314 length:930 start_codon:yes stop_codon:yes gene_type:complete
MSDNGVSIFSQSALPAHLQGAAADDSASGLVTTMDSIPRISIKGFQFTHRTKDAEKKLATKGCPIEVVIIAVDPPTKHLAKSYFKDKYDGENTAPDCSSANGVVPDHWVENPQCGACAGCPMNVFGAGKNEKGKDIKPCSDHKRLIVVPIDDINADFAAVQVPVMSLKSLSAFGKQLIKHEVPMTSMITELSFDQEAEYPRLVFTPKGFLSEDDFNAAKARAASDELQDLLNAAPTTTTAQPAGGAAELAAPTKEESIDAGLADRLEQEAPKKVLTVTAKAGKFTLDQFLAAPDWTEEKLIAQGYAEYK